MNADFRSTNPQPFGARSGLRAAADDGGRSRVSPQVVRVSRTARTCRALLMLLVLSLAGCASWRMGQQALYRPDVRTVHVPIFESDSYRRNLGERLAEAVAVQIEMRTPYRVADAASADSVLRGRIVSETKRVIAEDQYDIPRVIDTDLVARIDWVGPQGELLANNITVPLADYQMLVGQGEALIPEGGQSVSSAHQKAIEQLASQIVSQMEIAPW